MDTDLIRNKQDSVVRCVERVQGKASLPYDALIDNYDAQDVIVLNLERAIQQCVDIAAHILAETNVSPPETMRDAFVSLVSVDVLTQATCERMAKAVGFRNTAVHAYQAIDWQIVYSIITERLGDFASFIREVDDYIAGVRSGKEG